MPELLRSTKLAIEKGLSQGRDVSYLKFLTDSIIPALVEALHKAAVYGLGVCVEFGGSVFKPLVGGKLVEYDEPSKLMEDQSSSFSKLVVEYWSSCSRISL